MMPTGTVSPPRRLAAAIEVGGHQAARLAVLGVGPLRHRGRGLVPQEGVEKLLGPGRHLKQVNVFLLDEPLLTGMSHPGQERVEEPADVEQADGLPVDAQLRPGEDLEQLVQRPEAARQRHEGVAAVGHQRFTLVYSSRRGRFP